MYENDQYNISPKRWIMMLALSKIDVNLNKKGDTNFILLFLLKMDVFFLLLMKNAGALHGDNLCQDLR